MNAQSGIRAVATVVLAAGLLCGVAWADEEVEPNNTMDQAQPLVFDASGVATVNGRSAIGEPDIYVFWANGDDVITIDIDNGFHVTMGPDDTDTIVSLHGPGPAYTVVDVNDNSEFDDDGSSGAWGADPYISYTVESLESGYYYVAVTVSDDRVVDGGMWIPGSFFYTGGGTYTLIVSGATPKPAGDDTSGGTDTSGGGTPDTGSTPPDTSTETPPADEAQTVAIRVRPHARAIGRMNPKAKQVIPVAILSSDTFDASTIKQDSLTFGRTGDENSLRNCNPVLTRVDRDHRPDLVCYFHNDLAGFEPSSERGVLKGLTNGDTPFKGSGWLKALPEKRKFGHQHGKGHEKHDGDGRRHKGHNR